MKSSKELSSKLAFLVLIIGQHYVQSFSQNVGVKFLSKDIVLFGKGTRSRQTTTLVHSSSQNEGTDANNKDDNKTEGGSGFLPLPPIGESSFDPESFGGKQKYDVSGKSTTIALGSDKPTEVAMVGSAKFELQYTCNLCETKNSHKVSRLGKQ